MLLALVALLAATGSASAQEGRKVALVIGNSHYERLGNLRNPENDATDIAAALRGMNFQVVDGVDLSGRAFRRAVSEFSHLAKTADIALFYFSGHGLQFQSENYLIPVDAELDYELALNETVALKDIIEALGGARTSLIYIDACRSFPIEDTFLADVNERISVVSGLARPNLDEINNSFVGFSASAGRTASDGQGRNSPFTSAMLEFLPQRGLDVNMMFSQVIDRVRTATEGAQVPQGFNGIAGTLLLAGIGESTPAATAPAVAGRDFDRAAKFDTIPAYLAFLSAHPGGLYAELAKARIAQLQAAGGESPPSSESVAKLDVPVQVPDPPKPTVDRCDVLASAPGDPRAVSPGVSSLALERRNALVACAAAVAREPDNPRFAFLYGRVLDYMRRGDEAIVQYRRAAEGGYPEAMGEVLYFPYRFRTPDAAARSRLIEEFDRLDSERSQTIEFYKGLLLFNGGVDEKKRAHDIFTALAAKGGANSMIYLGIEEYIAGRYSLAFSWFEKALAAGTPTGYSTLALMYEDGRGVVADPEKAADYLLKFAKFQVPAPDLDDVAAIPGSTVVKALQRRLADLGYYKGAIDGIVGKGTREAYAAAGVID